MRRLLRQARLLTALALFFALPTLMASAAPPPGEYFNGFEVNTAGWIQLLGGTIHREPSGYISGNGYATGVPSAAGNWHARLGIDQNPDTCASGGGPQPVHSGPFTNWGGYSSFFPPGGYFTRVDIYLDVAVGSNPNRQALRLVLRGQHANGVHRRDFVFNVGTEPTGFVISGSNNGNRCGAFPANPGRMPVPCSRPAGTRSSTPSPASQVVRSWSP